MKKIAISCGDPAGIGPEIVEKWLREHPARAKQIIAIGPKTWLKKLPCEGIPAGPDDFEAVPGKPDKTGQQTALEAMERAAAITSAGKAAAVVTMPVNKSGLKTIGYAFPGQTEFFADRWGGEPTMAFAGGKLNVVLATWHIPFKDVPAALDETCLTRAVERADFLARALTKKTFPKIAVCGLNPHAGENGHIGGEEKKLDKILEKLRERFPNLSACLPPDTVFWRHLKGDFDVVVALYHDQGLAPLKTLEFDRSVNCTLGLPFVRTSPDHGTAYDIAGTGTAGTRSLENAFKTAKKLAAVF